MTTPIAFGLITIAVIFLVIIAFRRTMNAGDPMNDRLQTYLEIPEFISRRQSERSRTWLTRVRIQLNAAFSGLASRETAVHLMSANWPITPTEFVVLRMAGCIIIFLLSSLISDSFLVGIGATAITYLLPGLLLQTSTNRRRTKFGKQLVDVLVLMTGAVRAGFSLLQAIEVVGREMTPPSSEEFQRVIREVSLGRSLHQSLNDLSNRMENADLGLLVTAVNIQYQVGGNLAYMLNSVTETIRDRIRLLGEVRVLTTQQRLTAYVLSLLPFFVFGILFLIAPSYMMRLFDPSIICIPIGAMVGIILGFILVRRLAYIDI
jgi:tight adherence protein B